MAVFCAKEVIYECKDVISPDIMEYYVNKKLDDNNKTYFNEVNETSIDDEEGEETTETKN